MGLALHPDVEPAPLAHPARSQEEHDAALKFTFPMFSKPITHSQFLEKLGA
jgi:hypothetical protein